MDKRARKVSISVGISALNEERNIGKLIESILWQKENGYTIKEIIVISDGSTDQTVKSVLDFQDNRIKIVDSKERLGKATRLNWIFRNTKSEAIVIFDADVVLSTPDTIANLVLPLKDNKNVGIVSGRARPIEGETFIEKCVNASFDAYDDFRTKIRKGSNPYSAEGRIMLFSNMFARVVTLPKSMHCVDNFLYFSCITKGFSFKYAKSATVLYRSPSTLSEHIRQNTRFVSRDFRLESIFGDKVAKEYKIPRKIFFGSLLKTFINKPIYSSSIFLINLYCKYKARSEWKNIDDKWVAASTTKAQIYKR